MIFIPGLAVVFAGLLGGNGTVDNQVQAVMRDLHVESIALPAPALRTLTHHGDGTRDLVRGLNVDGVIGCEVITGHGAPSLRLVIYDHDGGLKTFSEVPLGARGLSKDDLDVLRSNLHDDVVALGGAAAKIEDEPAIDPIADAKPPIESAADADAVSADEIATLTAGDASPAAPATTRTLYLGAAAGIGIASRSFDPSPSTVTGYASTPVAAVVVEARIQPTARLALSVATERTLQLTTPMRDGSLAATTISRWEAGAAYTLLQRSSFEVGPRVGAGRRAFSIDSADSARSPDGDYNYVIVGVAAAAYLGPRITLRGNASFEPVVFGNEPTAMAFGGATRWAIDVGAAVDVRLWSHLFARIAAQYQRFTWSWDMAGARGAGGAVDEYPSGAISIGADY